MNNLRTKRLFFALILILTVSVLQALDLTIVGPPRAVLKMGNGDEVVIDPTGKYVLQNLNPGETVVFTTEIAGRHPADYAVEMGELSKTFRIDPAPTGVVAGELKFANAGFCPAFGLELYFNPEDAYISIDVYQSYISVSQMFTGSYDVSSRFIMPMIGAGVYVLPFDSFVRLNFGLSVGGGFGNEFPNALFVAEFAAGLEFKFLDHYILFVELNPRLHSPLQGGWDDYRDIYGVSQADSMFDVGSWTVFGFPSTIFGLKYKY